MALAHRALLDLPIGALKVLDDGRGHLCCSSSGEGHHYARPRGTPTTFRQCVTEMRSSRPRIVGPLRDSLVEEYWGLAFVGPFFLSLNCPGASSAIVLAI